MATLGELADLAGGACDGAQGAVEGIATDTRTPLAGKLFVAIRGPRFDGHDHLEAAVASGAVAAMVEGNADVPSGLPALRVDDTVAALGRMALGWRRRLPSLRVLAITGTAGKTTTKDTLASICASQMPTVASPRSFNNAIGVPLTILAARPTDSVLVAEVGTSGPGEIAPLADMLLPDVAVVTLIGRGHLEGLGDLAAVAAEKYALIEALGDEGRAFVRYGSPPPTGLAAIETFGFEPEADRVITDRGIGWMEFQGRRWRVGLPGRHGALNALASLLAARAVGIDDERIAAGLASVTPPPHRMATRLVGGICVIDDAWNANPESMHAVLDTVPELDLGAGRLVVILGDMLELGKESSTQHQRLAGVLERLSERVSVSVLILVGPEMTPLADVLPSRLCHTEIRHELHSDEACMDRIAAGLTPGDTVLLKASRGIGLERVIDRLESGASAC
ncbi:MAG: UDP-N-acetylmuramoyl-tripeptide--D-alanyl-D-alanine ligase [Phycisphaerales bacterium]|jgi:UDP-N-acetylmuramoyl-tripeptide--D-alanyl-D-alanine ligase|nr:UDP-N-acetylmuramoyl-tripeptide--D-alanyl-D-alanine ligase [Phycisphaerales bacterium]